MAEAPGTGITAAGFDAAQFMRYARRFGHGAALGIDYLAHGDDWTELVLPYGEHLIADLETGVIASGAIVSLMDMATSMAIWVKRNSFAPQATVDLRIDYLRPARPAQSIIGRGECYRITRNIAFVRGVAHDGDPADPLAHVAGTFISTGSWI
jgi:uncharacterized protein (TIGR00369 family)